MLPKKDIFPKSEKPFGYIDANPCINVTFINNRDNINKYLNLSPLMFIDISLQSISITAVELTYYVFKLYHCHDERSIGRSDQ